MCQHNIVLALTHPICVGCFVETNCDNNFKTIMCEQPTQSATRRGALHANISNIFLFPIDDLIHVFFFLLPTTLHENGGVFLVFMLNSLLS